MIENNQISKEPYIPEIKLDIDFDLAKQIEKNGYKVENWIKKCIDFGLKVEKGNIFQEIGTKNERLKISMCNFNPYPELQVSKMFDIPKKSLSKVEDLITKNNILEEPKVWIRRSITLGLIFPNVVFLKKTSRGWKDCTF
jgi:hypothetical protein